MRCSGAIFGALMVRATGRARGDRESPGGRPGVPGRFASPSRPERTSAVPGTGSSLSEPGQTSAVPVTDSSPNSPAPHSAVPATSAHATTDQG